jgi:hypothetical protein
MGPPSYMRSVFDRNVVMRHMTNIILPSGPGPPTFLIFRFVLPKFVTHFLSLPSAPRNT